MKQEDRFIGKDSDLTFEPSLSTYSIIRYIPLRDNWKHEPGTME